MIRTSVRWTIILSDITYLAYILHANQPNQLAMISSGSSIESKKLLLQFIVREISYEKECKKLAEVIYLSKRSNSIHEGLSEFFTDSIVDDLHLSELVEN